MPLTISSVCRNITPSTTLRLNALVSEKKQQGLDVISLAAGEPDFATPAHICQAGKRAIDEGRTKYTAVAGIPELRRALSEYLLSTRGLRYDARQTIIGTGAKQVLLGALQAILEPGDEVLLPAPCWLSYPEMVRMAGGVPVVVRTTMDQGYVPSREQLSWAVTPKTRAIILNSPNNPTGVVWDEPALRMVAEVARAQDFYIISDEIYEDLVYEGEKHIPIASLSEDAYARTITISGFSKAYAMTGWRLGYAAGNKAVIEAMEAYQSHATGNPSSVAQYAALAALTGDQACVEEMRQAFERRCAAMLAVLDAIPGVRYAKPHGAFYVLADVSRLLGKRFRGEVVDTDGRFAELLLEQALVSAVPGEPFFAPGCLRFSYAINEERLAEAGRRIKAFVQELE